MKIEKNRVKCEGKEFKLYWIEATLTLLSPTKERNN